LVRSNLLEKIRTKKVTPVKTNSKKRIPNISITVPEKITGNIEATVTKNQKLPKTLPRNSWGVDSCRKVFEGIVIPTNDAPISMIAKKPK
jgi:hypothetical protein